MGGWQHDDLLFLRGRPDLLREIERIDIKSAVVKKSPPITSITKARVSSSSSRSAKRGAKSVTKAVVVTDDRSFSSSSRDSQSSYNDDRSHVHNMGVGVAAVV